MRFKVDLQLEPSQIAYIFCWYYKQYAKWPAPPGYAAIREYLSEYGEPHSDKVEACENGAPNLMAKAMELVEKHLPSSFD